MKREYNFLFFLISFILIMGCTGYKPNPVSDFGYYYTTETTDEGYTFEGYMITAYYGSSKKVVIPKELRGDPFVIIDHGAFDSKELTDVSIPDSVEYIKIGAFRNNKLSTIKIPDSVKVIETGAFENNQISNLTIGNSVEIIGMRAFENNQIASVIIPDSVREIYARAFFNNQISSITVGNSVEYIGYHAFYNNNITFVALSDNIKNLDMSAFYVSLYDEYVRNMRKESKFYITLETFSDFEIAILNDSFIEILKYNGTEKDVIIPENIKGFPVVAIGTGAFSDHAVDFFGIGYVFTVQFGGRDSAVSEKEIASVFIPDSVMTIGHHSFYANQIANISIPDSVVNIGNIAFAGNKIESLHIGNSVEIIGEGAFSGNLLSNVTIPNTVSFINRGAFSGNPLKTITIPVSLKIITDDEYDSIFGSRFTGETPKIIRK